MEWTLYKGYQDKEDATCLERTREGTRHTRGGTPTPSENSQDFQLAKQDKGKTNPLSLFHSILSHPTPYFMSVHAF